jgi:putative thiamine transport system ATP-binding protein
MLEIKRLNLGKSDQMMFSDFNLQIAAGEIVTVMGVSGSGKSTLLNWIIGDLDAQFKASGELWLNGIRCDGFSIEKRQIGILFQDDLLFPHLSVGQNMAFALPSKFEGRKVRRQHIENLLAEVGLAGFHDRDPATLSGGQRARVSLLRALLAEPKALLLDEPFSRLDAVLREQFRAFVFEQIAQRGIPALLVTHDLADISPAGRIVEISSGVNNHVG